MSTHNMFSGIIKKNIVWILHLSGVMQYIQTFVWITVDSCYIDLNCLFQITAYLEVKI